jgi:hypothetical protein
MRSIMASELSTRDSYSLLSLRLQMGLGRDRAGRAGTDAPPATGQMSPVAAP